MDAFGWIVDRMKEGSTWAGLAVIAALVFGGDAETWTDLLMKLGTHVAGLIAVIASIAAIVVKK
jgi:hypothetical protein